jgi:hypothetical protein
LDYGNGQIYRELEFKTINFLDNIKDGIFGSRVAALVEIG